jgi:hypothetical protein
VLYVLLISYLGLVLVPYADLIDVLNLLHVVKMSNANMLLISVTKLTWKLLNNIAICIW